MATAKGKGKADAAVVYVAAELGGSDWKMAVGDADRHSIYQVTAGDHRAMSSRVQDWIRTRRIAGPVRIISCYEAGRDGFWVHRALTELGWENHVVDPSSIEVKRRAKHRKTDRLDARRLLRLLIRATGGEPDVWHVVNVPTEAQEDERRPMRERERLKKERTALRNRVGALLQLHGVHVRKVTRAVVRSAPQKRAWNGKPLPQHLTDELRRMGERHDLADKQIREIEQALSRRVQAVRAGDESRRRADPAAAKVRELSRLCGIGELSAWMFVTEFFGWRKFRNRRQVAGAAGLVPTPYDSGNSEREQGISKAGNRRIRSMAVEIAWCWLRFQPDSDIVLRFKEQYAPGSSRIRRIGCVALARQLLVELWRFLEYGVVPAGARLKSDADGREAA